MRESYSNENQFGFKTLNPAINKIVIVGGYGKMGQLFARYLRASGYPISILDLDDWDMAGTHFNECGCCYYLEYRLITR